MSEKNLGIIGGGQLGSLLADAAKKIGINTVIFSDDQDAPAKNFSNKFIHGSYSDQKIIDENVKNYLMSNGNIKDIDEYIVDISKKEGLVAGLYEIDGGVTVHHACHARAQNMGNIARDMLKLIPNIKIDVVERCAGHGGTFGVMKATYQHALKVGRPTAKQIKNKKNKYMAADWPLAGKHLKQLSEDTNIEHNEALHPIEILAKAYKL